MKKNLCNDVILQKRQFRIFSYLFGINSKESTKRRLHLKSRAEDDDIEFLSFKEIRRVDGHFSALIRAQSWQVIKEIAKHNFVWVESPDEGIHGYPSVIGIMDCKRVPKLKASVEIMLKSLSLRKFEFFPMTCKLCNVIIIIMKNFNPTKYA